MSTIRFDADDDTVVEGPHDYDVDERGGDGWAREEPETLWYLTENQSNGRWLYVDRPTTSGIEVGIARVYRKFLSSASARSLAAVLIEAADLNDALKAAAKAERDEIATRPRVCWKCGRRSSKPIEPPEGYCCGVHWCEDTHGGFLGHDLAGDWTIPVTLHCTRCGQWSPTVTTGYDGPIVHLLADETAGPASAHCGEPVVVDGRHVADATRERRVVNCRACLPASQP